MPKTNLNDLLPAAPPGRRNDLWQVGGWYYDPVRQDMVRYASVHYEPGGVNSQVNLATYTFQQYDFDTLVVLGNNSTVAVTLPAASGVGHTSGWFTFVLNLGPAEITITPDVGQINKASSLLLRAGDSARIESDGTNFYASVSRNTGGVDNQTGTSSTLSSADKSKLVTYSNSSPIAVTLPQGGTVGIDSTWYVALENRGVGTVIITAGGGSTIDGSGSAALRTDQGIWLFCDGANYFTVRSFARMQNIYDVSAAGTLDGQMLMYDQSNAVWTPARIIAGTNVSLVFGPASITVNVASSTGASGGLLVVEQSGSVVGSQPILNLIPGSNVSLTVVDNPGSNRVDVTIAAVASASGAGFTSIASRLIGASNAQATPDVTRAMGVTYQNTSAFPLFVMVLCQSSSNSTMNVFVDTVSPPTARVLRLGANSAHDRTVTFVVPPNYYYQVAENAGTPSNLFWSEFPLTKGGVTDSGDLSGSRVFGTVYQNTSGNPMLIEVYNSTGGELVGYADSAVAPTTIVADDADTNFGCCLSYWVMPGEYYKVTTTSGTVQHWHEYTFSGLTLTKSKQLVTFRGYAQAWQNQSAALMFSQISASMNASTGGYTVQADNGAPPLIYQTSVSTAAGAHKYSLNISLAGWFLKITGTSQSLTQWFEYALN